MFVVGCWMLFVLLTHVHKTVVIFVRCTFMKSWVRFIMYWCDLKSMLFYVVFRAKCMLVQLDML